jgi:hypothetical protein
MPRRLWPLPQGRQARIPAPGRVRLRRVDSPASQMRGQPGPQAALLWCCWRLPRESPWLPRPPGIPEARRRPLVSRPPTEQPPAPPPSQARLCLPGPLPREPRQLYQGPFSASQRHFRRLSAHSPPSRRLSAHPPSSWRPRARSAFQIFRASRPPDVPRRPTAATRLPGRRLRARPPRRRRRPRPSQALARARRASRPPAPGPVPPATRMTVARGPRRRTLAATPSTGGFRHPHAAKAPPPAAPARARQRWRPPGPRHRPASLHLRACRGLRAARGT